MLWKLTVGSTLCVIGLSLLLPKRIWMSKGRWKTGEPSKSVTVVMCLLGIGCTAFGAYLLYLMAK